MKNNITLLQRHMETLCETIGARPTGSAKNKAAVDYAFMEFQKCGLEVRKQEFGCIDWNDFGAMLLIDGLNVPVYPAEYALACDIEAEFVCIDSVEMLEKSELSSKIAFLHGYLCKDPLMPKNFQFWNPDEHKRIISLLEEKNPIAIITVSPMSDVPISIIQDGDFNIPCAVVCGSALETLLRSSERKAKLIIKTERIQTKAHNVIATYGSGNERICFSAHIDTKPNTPGALDNASGVAVLLALADSFTKKYYPFQVEFVLLNGEDYYSTPGEIVYMSQLTPSYIMAINVDGVGLKGSATSISFYECSQELEMRMIQVASKLCGIERIEPWPMGDHMMFATVDIPAIAITACDIFGMFETVIHTPDDDMKNVDLDILNNVVNFLSDTI